MMRVTRNRRWASWALWALWAWAYLDVSILAVLMPPRKKHKLAQITGLRGVSDAALHDILKLIREDPALFLDDAFSLSTVHRASFGILDAIGEDIEMPTATRCSCQSTTMLHTPAQLAKFTILVLCYVHEKAQDIEAVGRPAVPQKR